MNAQDVKTIRETISSVEYDYGTDEHIAQELEKLGYCRVEDILHPLYELCKERKEIQWDDIWFLVMRYGVKIDD